MRLSWIGLWNLKHRAEATRRAVKRKPHLGAAKRRVLAMALAVAATLMGFGAAGADDLYLRVGLGLDRPAETRFTDRDCSSTSPAALYGCGRGGEGRANLLEPGRRQSVAAELSTLSGMLAVYVDLAALGVPELSPVGPFIGGGVGIVRTRIGETRMTFPKTTTIVPGASRTDAAWMLTAGVALALDERLTLDLAWRYTDLGEVRTGRGAGRVVWRDGSRQPLPLDFAATRARLRSHGLRLSLRYAF